MTDLIFSTPWWLPVVIAIGGIAAFISGNARQKSSMRNAGLGIVAAAVLLAVVSYFVETDKEKVLRLSKEMVQDVAGGDWQKFDALLGPHAVVSVSGASIYPNRQAVLDGTKKSVDQYGVKSAYVSSINATQEGQYITANLEVYSVQTATMERPVPTNWQFEWEEGSNGWKLARIDCVKVGDQSTQSIGRLFAH